MDQVRAAKAADRAILACSQKIQGSTPRTIPGWVYTSLPYLKAIRSGDYGYEDPKMCVLYALNSLTGWRGEEAREIKYQLNESIK